VFVNPQPTTNFYTDLSWDVQSLILCQQWRMGRMGKGGLIVEEGQTE